MSTNNYSFNIGANGIISSVSPSLNDLPAAPSVVFDPTDSISYSPVTNAEYAAKHLVITIFLKGGNAVSAGFSYYNVASTAAAQKVGIEAEITSFENDSSGTFKYQWDFKSTTLTNNVVVMYRNGAKVAYDKEGSTPTNDTNAISCVWLYGSTSKWAYNNESKYCQGNTDITSTSHTDSSKLHYITVFIKAHNT